MMDFRQRLEQSRIQLVGNHPQPDTEPEPATKSPYFAAAGGSSPVCLELRLPDGKRMAIPYAFFTELAYAAETGIGILTPAKRIIITGRNLSGLFDHLVAYRVRYIQANIGGDTEEDGLFVDEIQIGDAD